MFERWLDYARTSLASQPTRCFAHRGRTSQKKKPPSSCLLSYFGRRMTDIRHSHDEVLPDASAASTRYVYVFDSSCNPSHALRSPPDGSRVRAAPKLRWDSEAACACRSAQRRIKALLVSASVGLALAAVITLGYNAAASDSPAKASVLFAPRFMVLADAGASASAATAAEEAVGRAEGGKWDNVDVGRGLGGKWDIANNKKVVQSPDLAAKYGLAAATASQRMFNQIGIARDGSPVTESQARSIASRYGMVPVSLHKPLKMVWQGVQMVPAQVPAQTVPAPAPVSYATVPAPPMAAMQGPVSYATVPAGPSAVPPPGYKIVAGPPQMSMQMVPTQPAQPVEIQVAAPQAMAVAGLTAEQAAAQGQAASDGVSAPTDEAAPVEQTEGPAPAQIVEQPEAAQELQAQEPASPKESAPPPPVEAESSPPAEAEYAAPAAPEPAAPAPATEDAPTIENSPSAWGIPLLSAPTMSGKPVVFSGPKFVTSPYALPAPTWAAPAALPLGVPAVVAGAARLIPSPASSVFRFMSNAPGSGVSEAPLGAGKMSVTGMSGVGSEFMVQQGQVSGQGLSAQKGVGQGVGVSVAQGDGKGMGLTVGSGQEAGYGLSAVSGSAAGDGVVVAQGVAQGRGITVHQGSVAGQGILIGDDGTGHGEFIGSGSGSGTDISVSKGTAVGEGISMAQGQASGKGLTVNDGAVKGSGLAGRQGSGDGLGLAVGSGSVRGIDVKVVQGSVAGEGIYVQVLHPCLCVVHTFV